MNKNIRERIKLYQHSLFPDSLADLVSYTIRQAQALQQIPGPTFGEAERADYARAQFEIFALADIEVDALYNVYARLPGSSADLPGVMVTAHSDTVFPADLDLSLRHEDTLIYGPGLGDNCIGVGGMFGLLAALRQQQIQPECDIWFVVTSREEGLGNLGGMRAAYHKLVSRIDAVINLEGLAFGHIYHAGIAVRRLHITAQSAGGHSWLHFGRASAIHGIVELSSHILNTKVPRSPRTTYNIGMVEGGQGINVIATSAGIWLDLRSEERLALDELEQQVRAYIQELSNEELQFAIEVVGDRPSGFIDPEHELVTGALLALEMVGVLGVLETGSTDANVPLAAGCPAVTIGITRGGNAHRPDEYIELEPIEAGLRQLILLVLGVSGINKP